MTAVPAKRPLGNSGVKKISSSNPLVRKRMQLVEKWQKSREKDEESEEEVSFLTVLLSYMLLTALGIIKFEHQYILLYWRPSLVIPKAVVHVCRTMTNGRRD